VTDTRISRQIGVRLPNETHDALTKLAKEQRRPLGWLVRDFIEAGLAREATQKAKRKARSV
jgi:predicted DNA-binding protein